MLEGAGTVSRHGNQVCAPFSCQLSDLETGLAGTSEHRMRNARVRQLLLAARRCLKALFAAPGAQHVVVRRHDALEHGQRGFEVDEIDVDGAEQVAKRDDAFDRQ